MSLFEKIQQLCKENNVTIGALEKKLGFSNGSIRKLRDKHTSMKADRLSLVAEYFNIPIDYFYDEEVKCEIDNEPKIFDIDKELNDLIRKLNISDQLAFSGETLTDELTDISKEQLLMSLKFILNQQQHLAEQD